MIPSQRVPNQPSQFIIQQLIRLFEIYIEGPQGCRQRSYRLLEQYPRSLIVIEIAAACDSLIGKYSQAITGYQKCLEIAPKTLAYTNNQAWNFIQLKDYEIAMTLLSDIKNKWNHPAIYSNWVTVLQNIGQNSNLLQQTIRKRDQFLRDYPQYKREGKNELIHTFLLKPEDNYTGETQDFRTQIFELVQVLRKIQRAPVSFQTLRERLQFMEEKINARKLQEQKSGFVIDTLFRIALAGLELLQTKILNNYQQKHSEQLQKYVLKSIEFINNHLFSERVEENFDYKKFEESKLVPTVFQIIEIGEFMHEKLEHLRGSQLSNIENAQMRELEPVVVQNHRQLNQQRQKKQDRIAVQQAIRKENDEISQKLDQLQKIGDQIRKPEVIQKNVQQKVVDVQNAIKQNERKVLNQQKISLNVVQINRGNKNIKSTKQQIKQKYQHNIQQKVENPHPIIQGDSYHFCIREQELQQMEKQKAEYLVQKLRIDGQNQASPLFVILHFRQNMKDSYIIFTNHRRVNQQILKQPNLPNLQRLSSQIQKAQVKRYYFILANLLKIYNFYGTRNFIYQRKNVKSHLDCQHYLQLIAPVLNHIFIDEDYFSNYQVGSICQKIHSFICNYINQTRKKGDFLRSYNRILKRIHEIVGKYQNPVQNLLESLLGQKNLQYTGILLNNQLLNVDGSTKYHEYYISRMNKDKQGNSDQNWLIFNISILVISILENNQEGQSLQKIFLDCYYCSRVTDPLKNLILRKFYSANHQIPLIEKVSLGFKNIFTKILP